MDAWKQLVNTTLLGTEKASGEEALLQSLPALHEVQQSLSARQGDREAKLLETMAVLYAYRRCGAKPLAEKVAASVAGQEAKPYCSREATTALTDILQIGSMGLLELWLRQCDAKGQIVSPALIDVLLQTAVPHKALRTLIVSCCGKRGEWLSSLNGDWAFQTEGTDPERWETGITGARIEILTAIRKEAPAKARAMLEAVWTEEKAEVREALLQVMETALSAEDLPFLESAATDKSKRVQAMAYDLLTQLPGSNIVKAYEAVLRESVKLQTTRKLLGIMSKTALDISFPKELDKSILEAVGKKPQEWNNTSDEEFRLLRMIAGVPPHFWEGHLGLAPQRILELFDEVSKDRHYKAALRQATIRHRASNWALLFKNEPEEFHIGLLELLPEAEANAYLAAAAKASPMSVIAYYGNKSIEWAAGLTPTLLSLVAGNPYAFNKGFFSTNAHLIPLSALSQLAAISPTTEAQANDYMRQYAQQTWGNTQAHLTTLLELKQRTFKAFQN